MDRLWETRGVEQKAGSCGCKSEVVSSNSPVKSESLFGTLVDNYRLVFGLCEKVKSTRPELLSRTPISTTRDLLIPSTKHQFAQFESVEESSNSPVIAVVRRIGRLPSGDMPESRFQSICFSIEAAAGIASDLNKSMEAAGVAIMPSNVTLGEHLEEWLARSLHSTDAPSGLAKAKALTTPSVLKWLIRKAKSGFLLTDLTCHVGPSMGVVLVKLHSHSIHVSDRRSLVVEVPLLTLNDLKLSSAKSEILDYVGIPDEHVHEVEADWTP